MKQSLLFLYFSLFFISCNFNTNNKKESIKNSKTLEKKFFTYDEIDYYKIIIDDLKLDDQFKKKKKSELDLLKQGIIINNIPKNIADTNYIEKLEKLGFKKTNISSSKFKNIDSIFSEKLVIEYLETACVHVYRDILIFKLKLKVVGTAKICFSCHANQIHGATFNTQMETTKDLKTS